MKLFRVATALTLSLALPLTASAKASPQKTLEQAQTRLESLLSSAPAKGSAASRERRAKLEAEARKLFDFAELSRRALGKHWESGSPDQQAEFVELFTSLVEDTYLDQLEGQSSKGLSLTWGKEEITGNLAKVEAVISGTSPEGKPVEIQMVYKLIQHPSGWMVYDVVTDGSSLEASYRSTFNKMFKKEGEFEGVLEQLRAKLGKNPPVKAAEKEVSVPPEKSKEKPKVAVPMPELSKGTTKAPEAAPKGESVKNTAPDPSRWEVFCSTVARSLRPVFLGRFSVILGYLRDLAASPKLASANL